MSTSSSSGANRSSTNLSSASDTPPGNTSSTLRSPPQTSRGMLDALMRECDETGEQLAALVEIGEAIPVDELEALLNYAKALHLAMQSCLRLARMAN